jgi:hypothetical protein
MWRTRWLDNQNRLAEAEASEAADEALRTIVLAIFSDEARPGTPSQFSLEQVCKLWRWRVKTRLEVDDPPVNGVCENSGGDNDLEALI